MSNSGNPPTVTLKQNAFANLVAGGESYTQAYIKAYGEDDLTSSVAKNLGSRLMRKPHVKARVEELRLERIVADQKDERVTKEWTITKLKAMVDNENTSDAVRVRALEVIAKSQKLFSDNTMVTVEHRSSAEIEKELREKLKLYLGEDLDDITLVS